MLYIANWKCNFNTQLVKGFASKIVRLYNSDSKNKIIIAPPFPFIPTLNEVEDRKFEIAAQNVSHLSIGNATGEVSAVMLKDAGASYVIVGHSERRQHFNEANAMLLNKIKNAHNAGMKVIFCIGELRSARDTGNFLDVLRGQLEVLSNYSRRDEIILAYEPVWAIGTGFSANNEEIEEVVEFLQLQLGKDTCILYGGSVTAANIKQLRRIKGLGGFLIGSASLTAESFADIVDK